MSRRRVTDLDRLLQSRFRSKRELTKVFRQWPAPADASYLTGVYKGQFYRIKVPPTKPSLPNLPRLPNPQMKPVSFQSKSGASSSHQASHAVSREGSSSGGASHHGRSQHHRDHHHHQQHQRHQQQSSSWRDWSVAAAEWYKTNWAVLIFNFGSICTLVGFTRSDVLELRTLSVTGSLSAVIYNLTQMPVRWPPILWSSTFAAVNAWKIYEILTERGATVHLTAKQEQVYVQHFMPHGVTPKQFEVLDSKAETLLLKKNSFLIKQGDKLDYVYLVVEGSTAASILGRHLTAASTTPTAHQDRVGGASGAWVGEMGFLENYWIKEQQQYNKKAADHDTGATKTPKRRNSKPAAPVAAAAAAVTGEAPQTVDNSDNNDEKAKPFRPPEQTRPPKPKSSRAMYSIRAKEDCVVLRWSHADMETLMARSTDMRAALTRAMTAAIVAKVINFTVSRGKPTWSSWLTDWKHAGGTIQVDEEDEDDDDEDADIAGNAKGEALPTYGIKKFSNDEARKKTPVKP